MCGPFFLFASASTGTQGDDTHRPLYLRRRLSEPDTWLDAQRSVASLVLLLSRWLHDISRCLEVCGMGAIKEARSDKSGLESCMKSMVAATKQRIQAALMNPVTLRAPRRNSEKEAVLAQFSPDKAWFWAQVQH